LLPPNRHFGLLFSAVFACAFAYCVLREANFAITVVWLAGALATGLTTWLAPERLTPFNRAWMKLGEWMGRIVSPIVLGVVFFGLITPAGFVSRLFGRDELRLRRRPVASYWVRRAPPGPGAASFRQQF
jgi:hypothetical protein